MKYPRINNRYTFKCYDRTGKLTRQVVTHNVVLNNYYRTYSPVFTYMYLELGSGTAEPNVSDTRLTNWLFNAEDPQPYTAERISDTHIKVSATFVVPADSSHVGTISEFGLSLGGGNSELLTKGLLRDSEGQTITIEKTDLDRLTVDVELHLLLDESDGFFWLTSPAASLRRSFGLWTSSSTSIRFAIAKRHKKYDMCYERGYDYTQFSATHTLDPVACNQDPSTLLTKFGPSRLPASSSLNGHYVHGIELVRPYSTCAWYFPSEQFPTKTINNIAIGVGNGITTEFEPPIPLWLENTDKIYVAGVQQTRGVDYTIEHNANRQRLPEVTPGSILDDYTKDGDYSTVPDWILKEYYPIPFSAYVDTGVVLVQSSSITVKLSSDGAIGDKVNYWIPGCFAIYDADGYSRSATGAIIKLFSSADGEVFTQRDTYVYDSAYAVPRNLPTTTDKYWRLTCDLSDTPYLDGCLFEPDDRASSILGYYGEPIKFVMPPAEGEKIIMSLTLDRPYKNENFVMDIYPEFRFGGA